jgi:hypothetical protein
MIIAARGAGPVSCSIVSRVMSVGSLSFAADRKSRRSAQQFARCVALTG